MTKSKEEKTLEASRREALQLMLAAAGAGVAASGAVTPAQAQAPLNSQAPKGPVRQKPYLCLVSRHLQWTEMEHGLDVANTAGFAGVLWSVRGGAHIEPNEVAAKLPPIVKRTRDKGMEVPMIIAGIGEADSANAEGIMDTMNKLGIKLYRAGSSRYDFNAPLQPQFDALRKKMEGIVALNAKHGVCAAYHTHAYAQSIGGSAWDLWECMRGLDPRWVGMNYDIGHITAKGGNGWRESIRAVGDYLHSCSIKDFVWEKEPVVPEGQYPWRTRFVRPGDGMVNFPEFFRYLQSINFQGPLENYFEYSVRVPNLDYPFDMLGTNYKQWKLEMPEETFIGFLKRDVAFYNDTWTKALTTPAPAEVSMKAGDGPNGTPLRRPDQGGGQGGGGRRGGN